MFIRNYYKLYNIVTTVQVQFERDSYTVNEGDGTATIRVVKVGTSSIPVTVTVDTSDISATGIV